MRWVSVVTGIIGLVLNSWSTLTGGVDWLRIFFFTAFASFVAYGLLTSPPDTTHEQSNDEDSP